MQGYEEIVGKSKIELEDEFISTVRVGSRIEYPFCPEGYEKAGGYFYVKKGSEYCLKQVRNDSYAIKKEGKLEPLISMSYPLESILTLFTVPSAAQNLEIELHHHKYGFTEDRYVVNLADLLVSCMNAGCVPYVGIEECMADTSFPVSVFLVNETCGYNHILKVNIPVSLFKKTEGCLSADLYTYVPTHNISDLFAK